MRVIKFIKHVWNAIFGVTDFNNVSLDRDTAILSYNIWT